MIRRVQINMQVAHSLLKMLPTYAGGAGSCIRPQSANEIDQQTKAQRLLNERVRIASSAILCHPQLDTPPQPHQPHHLLEEEEKRWLDTDAA